MSEIDNIREEVKKYFPEISKSGVVEKGQFKLERFDNVPFPVNVILGRKNITIKEIEALNINDVIELDKEAGGQMTIYINGIPLFYGEVFINEDTFSIRITQIIDEKISPDYYLKDMNYFLGGLTKETKARKFNKKRFYDVKIDLRVEIGQITLPLKKILDWDIGYIIELYKNINEPIIAYGNNIPLFYGKIVAIEDNFGFEITDVIKKDDGVKL